MDLQRANAGRIVNRRVLESLHSTSGLVGEKQKFDVDLKPDGRGTLLLVAPKRTQRSLRSSARQSTHAITLQNAEYSTRGNTQSVITLQVPADS
jgi:hypothetical protein